MLQLARYSFGVGDRFAHQAAAQLQACVAASARGVTVTPVWNKSHREHTIVGSSPADVRAAADKAVADLGWTGAYFADADHINFSNVDAFLGASDFFTLDVAYAIGRPADPESVGLFLKRHPELTGGLRIPGLEEPLVMSREDIARVASKYLFAVEEAARIYRHVAGHKGAGGFVTEVSMDETDAPQTPAELMVILAALADQKVPAQTIAPKFTGRFNKGVDYVGDVGRFEQEFLSDLGVIALAVGLYGLPQDLKLSVHSGSDKFSIYPPIRRALEATGAGIHVKTAGTTWLEELIGLAEAGGDGLALAKEVYAEAHGHFDELCAPYASVIDIARDSLPAPVEVSAWSSGEFVAALRHDPLCEGFNPDLRQLLHVGYKVAAKMGARYTGMLDSCRGSVAANVTHNLYERHIKPLFLPA